MQAGSDAFSKIKLDVPPKKTGRKSA